MGRKQDLSYSGKYDPESENSFEESQKDKSYKKVQKEKAGSKKDKPIKKEKIPMRISKKEQKKLQRPSSIPKNDYEMREYIFDSQNQFELSQFKNYEPVIRNQQGSQEQSQPQSNLNTSQENQLSTYKNSQVLQNLLMIFTQFFISIDQQNGLVFKPQFRKKLKKRFPQINFTDEHHLEPNGKELTKIRLQIPHNLFIFDKENHNVQMSDQQFQQYIKDDVKKMVCVFKQTNYIFCQQVTPELYDILKKLCNIVIRYKNDSQETLIQHLRQFGDKIASQNDKQHKYLFFGYKFLTFPQNLTQNELRVQEKKEKYKFALKNKYRQPGTQFAQFAENAGLYLQGIMRQLKCYITLK